MKTHQATRPVMSTLAGLVIACTSLFACGGENPQLTGVDGGQSDLDGGGEESLAPTYIKASNTEANDSFGWELSLSADGKTLAIAAPAEDSAVGGVDGDEADNSASSSGAVYIFVHDGSRWIQEAYLKASNPDAEDGFGRSVSLSANGSTLAVGAFKEASDSSGVAGDPEDNSAPGSGAAYIFKRSGSTWSQEAYLKASNAASDTLFGSAIHLSASGDTLAVGAMAQRDSVTFFESGAVYVFQRASNAWSEEAFLKASNEFHEDLFGIEIRLSDDGQTLAVAAPGEDSNATGIDGDETDDTKGNSGAVYVFTKAGAAWGQSAYLKASNGDILDLFSIGALDLSGDGRVLAVGAAYEDSSATGIDGSQSDNDAQDAGAVYVFTNTGGQWQQSAYVKASNTNQEDFFGFSVSLSADGTRMAIGAVSEDGSTSGSDGDDSDNSAQDAGAVYLFDNSGGEWTQTSYLKASNTNSEDFFGISVSLSGDGETLAVGALQESSSAVGVGGDQANNSSPLSGAAYIY